MYYEYADTLQSEMRAEMAQEARNMVEAAVTRRECGEYCVVAWNADWEDGFGLQDYGITKEEAVTSMNKCASEEEYLGVLHEVMTHDEFEDLCYKMAVSRDFPWE